MDDIRGIYSGRQGDAGADPVSADTTQAPAAAASLVDVAIEAPPAIGQDERRMQVRAYNHWAGLLNNRSFPSIEDLHPDDIPDFGPFSVLLDFTGGIENPAIAYLGDKLGHECGTDSSITHLDNVPARSLLSRITDHYMQILANQAPIGFEAEFTNHVGQNIMYRGILLPFSSDDDTIDFIYGVINWKEGASPQLQSDIEAELAQDAADPVASVPRRAADPATSWADGPAVDAAASAILAGQAYEPSLDRDLGDELGWDEAADLSADHAPANDRAGFELLSADLPEPAFGRNVSPAAELAAVDEAAPLDLGDFAADDADEPITLESSSADTQPAGLADQLAMARESALAARGSEDRTRSALYQAVSRAYDFALAAEAEPQDYAEILEDAGLAVQDRAPMTPIVKLVFGVDYDKTRLTEYATVLGHARRIGIGAGALGGYLAKQPGGVKSLVAEERKLRRGEEPAAEARIDPRKVLAKKLRSMDAMAFDDLAFDGQEFALLMVRRTALGDIELLGEVPHDVALLEKAARKLIG